MMTLKDKIIVYGGLGLLYLAGIASNLYHWSTL